MNRVRGKARYEDDDCIQKAAEEYLLKDAEKKARKEKVENAQSMNNTQTAGKKKPKIKITKGKLGMKAKKKDTDEDEAARLAAQKKNAIEIKGMEEMHW